MRALQTNFFDLNGAGVVFTPAGGGHTITRGALAYDTEAQNNGLQITLGDDDVLVWKEEVDDSRRADVDAAMNACPMMAIRLS